ncbi:hypothetical protein SLS58_009770 [Diplodia intermedia]|uniref:Uncharacterized protein n=1 Tax=Diplodia intermedia TaxID=856260 RepID=A0ABR3TAB3_9PEZI
MLQNTLNVMKEFTHNAILPILHWVSIHEHPITVFTTAACLIVLLDTTVHVARGLLRLLRRTADAGVPVIGPCLHALWLACHAGGLVVYAAAVRPASVTLRVAAFLFLAQILLNALPERLHREFPDVVPALGRVTVPYASRERVAWDEVEEHVRASLPVGLRPERVCVPRILARDNAWDKAVRYVVARVGGECVWVPSGCRGQDWAGTVACENPNVRLRMEDWVRELLDVGPQRGRRSRAKAGFTEG